MSYAGVLEPLLQSVERIAPVSSGRLTGQHVITLRRDVTVLIAIDDDRNVHLLLAPAPANDRRFSRFNLKTLSVTIREWAVAGAPKQEYLDLLCSEGTQPAFRRPFLAFCEDLLVDLDRPGVMPEEAAFRTCTRWQRFWTADDDSPVSVEWIRGLLGEVLFLELLIGRLGPVSVKRWTGPAAEDHDFQAMSRVAFEVKVAATVPYVIECNLNQLDSTLFRELYLVCYHAVRADTGESLTDAVARIETAISSDDQILDEFHSALQKTGYRRQRRSDYDTFRFAVGSPRFYTVSDRFPRITYGSFNPPLDARIRGVRYQLELAGIDPLPEDTPEISAAISQLL